MSLAKGSEPGYFLPKLNKFLARKTSFTVTRRIVTVPLGHLVPFKCHICQSNTFRVVVGIFSYSSVLSSFVFGNSGGTFCHVTQIFNS